MNDDIQVLYINHDIYVDDICSCHAFLFKFKKKTLRMVGEKHFAYSSLKKHKMFFPSIRSARARISNSVSRGQCHLIHFNILRSFSFDSVRPVRTQRWHKTTVIHSFTSMLKTGRSITVNLLTRKHVKELNIFCISYGEQRGF